MEGEYGDAPEDFRPLAAQPMYKFVQRRGNIGSVIFETAEAPQQLRTAVVGGWTTAAGATRNSAGQNLDSMAGDHVMPGSFGCFRASPSAVNTGGSFPCPSPGVRAATFAVCNTQPPMPTSCSPGYGYGTCGLVGPASEAAGGVAGWPDPYSAGCASRPVNQWAGVIEREEQRREARKRRAQAFEFVDFTTRQHGSDEAHTRCHPGSCGFSVGATAADNTGHVAAAPPQTPFGAPIDGRPNFGQSPSEPPPPLPPLPLPPSLSPDMPQPPQRPFDGALPVQSTGAVRHRQDSAAQGKRKASKDMRNGPVLRTPEEITSGLGAQHDVKAAQLNAKGDGFAVGPLPGLNADKLLTKTKNVSANLLEGGGGWGANKCRTRSANTAVGSRLTFGCHHRGHNSLAGLGCRWELTYELSTEGWVVYKYQPSHNAEKDGPAIHELDKDVSQTMAYAAGRVFDPALIPFGETLQKTGFSPTQMFEALQTHAKTHGLSTSFNVEDVRSRFPQSSTERDYDATGLVEYLAERQRDMGMKSYVKTDQSGHINRVFVQLDNSMEEYACSGQNNVIMFDPTAGTNRYGLKLCCFTTVGSTGQTVVLAFALLLYEDEEQIEWSFRCFMDVFRVPPNTLLTDGAGSIEAAVKACASPGDILEHCTHLLCVFHIWKNFYQHIHPILVGKQDVWRQVCHMFWRLAKTSDVTFANSSEFEQLTSDWITTCVVPCQKDFDSYWDEMVTLIFQHAAGTTVDGAKVWLSKLHSIRKKWAASFTWGVLTWGLHSTQRSEAIHSAIKRRRALVGFHLVNLTHNLVDYNVATRLARDVDNIRSSLKHLSQSAVQDPETEAVREQITPYAFDLLRSQVSQALRYEYLDEVAGQHEGADVYFVRPVETATPLREDQPFTFDDADAPCDFGHYDDFGIGEPLKINGHWTTVNWCSCQFLSSYLIPCRHTIMLRIRLREKEQRRSLLDLIGNKWHRRDGTLQAQEMLRLSSNITFHHLKNPVTYTREERFNKLTDELRSLADLGSRSMDTFHVVLANIPKMASAVSQSDPQRASTPADGSTTEWHAEGFSMCAATSAETGPAKRRTPDSVQLHNILGTRFVIGKIPLREALLHMSEAGAALVGTYIASKWEPKGKKGWMVGRIVAQLPAMGDDASDDDSSASEKDNFSIAYSDGFTMPILLDLNDYCKDVSANHESDSWVVLEEKSLGDDVEQMVCDGLLHNPQLARATGKGSRGGRLQPQQGGPTSSQYNKHASKKKKKN